MQGVQIFHYLEDWLIKGMSKSQVQGSIAIVQTTCQVLGLLINEQKSMLVPVQKIELIGVVLDST